MRREIRKYLFDIDQACQLPEQFTAGKDLAGYLAWAKARGGQVFMGTFGAGTPGHFGAAILAREAGLDAAPVHFRSTGDAVAAALSGDVQGMFGSVALVAPHVRAGKLKALATTGPARSALLPEVPTTTELGLPSLAFTAWFGLVAPAATPGPALAELEAAALRALSAAPVRARMQEAGFRVAGNGRAALAALMRDEAVVVERTAMVEAASGTSTVTARTDRA